LQLNDGSTTHTFKAKDGNININGNEDVIKEVNTTFTAAGKTGTAQVHKADFGSIYFTLMDGTTNPTLTVSHKTGDVWSLIRKGAIKTSDHVIEVDKNFIDGLLKEASLTQIDKNLGSLAHDTIFNTVPDIFMLPSRFGMGSSAYSDEPAKSNADWQNIGLGVGVGGVVGGLSKFIYDKYKGNKKSDMADYLKWIGAGAVGLPLVGTLQNMAFPSYSDHLWKYRGKDLEDKEKIDIDFAKDKNTYMDDLMDKNIPLYGDKDANRALDAVKSKIPTEEYDKYYNTKKEQWLNSINYRRAVASGYEQAAKNILSDKTKSNLQIQQELADLTKDKLRSARDINIERFFGVRENE
jgi:hypothetical protein